MDHNEVRIARLTRNLRDLAAFASEHCAGELARIDEAVKIARQHTAGDSSPQSRGRTARRKRAAVVAWDLAHNPVGRAFVIYRLLESDWDVELIGPMWARYGRQVWGPIRNAGLRMRTFSCNNLQDFVPKAEVLAATRRYDLVYVCKPRLPSLYIGALLKDGSCCPLLCDVDDYELSFFSNEASLDFEEIREQADTALHEPFEELATRYAQGLIAACDAITVSNVVLQKRFGGHMVRHARAENEFVNSSERRGAARRRLGIADNEFALVFIGTPRPHKGVLEVAKALESIKDSSIVFHIVGNIGDRDLAAALSQFANARIYCHPDCEFEDLPNLLAGADLVPLIQDASHPISQYQIPAKISDALSLGIPVLATDVPPVADLIAAGAIHGTQPSALADALREMRQIYRDRSRPCQAERRWFTGELGKEINTLRMKHAIAEADAAHQAMMQESDDRRLHRDLADMVQLMRATYARRRRAQLQSSTGMRELSSTDDKLRQFTVKDSIGRRLPGFITGRPRQYDIAFFWKQNDSGMYGRRSDMIARYLSASGRINRLVHFDAPVSAPSLDQHFGTDCLMNNEQQDLLLQVMVDRQLGLYDTEITRHRTYLGSGRPARANFLGQSVGKKTSYVRFVREQIEAAGLRPHKTIAWFCPVIWDAVELIDKVGFAGVVADLIDDQRAWENNPAAEKRMDANYRNTLEAADLVIANCQSLAEAMNSFVDPIHVVPNGAERVIDFPLGPVPSTLQSIKRPIAGYVGNLRDRIDWLLLQDVVTALPDISFVFYGPASDNPNADSLNKHENVHMPGVLPYADLAEHLRHFDVGLVPHLNNRLTERMNPLKVYNYFAAGLPIVSTEVNNVEQLGNCLHTAANSDDFVEKIRAAVAMRVDTGSADWQMTMNRIAWDTRVEQILNLMDQAFSSRFRRSA